MSPLECLHGILDSSGVLLLRTETIVDGDDHTVGPCKSSFRNGAVVLVRTRVNLRLHMLDEKAFSVSMRPRVHPPGNKNELIRFGSNALEAERARTSMEEDEHRPASLRWLALRSEGAYHAVAKREVLDLANRERFGAPEDGGLLADLGGPRDLVEGRGVHEVLAMEGGILVEEFRLDLGVDGLEDGAVGHGVQWVCAQRCVHKVYMMAGRIGAGR